MREQITYKDAGVDIDAADVATSRIKRLARTTFNERVLSDIGSFGGMFSGLFPQMREPVLVASCDGVGTKLKIAFASGIHHTVGYDLVAHCIDDILVQGARPLFFLDYIATGRLDPEIIEQVIAGMTRGCVEGGCALLGGETAEMPEFYADGEYDIAGFIVGVVDRTKIIDGKRITAGDVAIALPSVGLHTNGYSLARKLLLDIAGYQIDSRVEELGGTVAEELLKPHRNYLPALDRILAHDGVIKGLAHITGGGLTDNVPRILPGNVDLAIEDGSWPVLPVFSLLQKIGNVPRDEMRRTFNLGLGMVIITAREHAALVEEELRGAGEAHYRIGEVVAGEGKVRWV